MNSHPTVSVMIPCFNSAKTLPLALKSLLKQDFKDWEALIIDDGSNDNPEKIVKELNDPRLRFFRLPENRGRATARQTALDNMQGEFLTMLDADDWIVPWKLKMQVEALKSNPELALVSSAMYFASNENELIGVARFNTKESLKKYPPLRSPTALPIAHAPILVRSQFVKGRKYDASLTYSEDYDFFLPILMKNSFGNLAEPLYVYRYEGNRTHQKYVLQLQSYRRVLAKYLSGYFISVSKQILFIYLKILISGIFNLIGNDKVLKNRGLQQATETEKNKFHEAERAISGV
jgi:glycosyltransferase involved in cell wall biosynthesis